MGLARRGSQTMTKTRIAATRSGNAVQAACGPDKALPAKLEDFQTIRVRLGDLGLAPENLRFDETVDEDIPQLAETIGAAGMLITPIVRPGRKTEALLMVLDGRRRRMALLLRRDRGEIDDDHLVTCQVAVSKAAQAAALVLPNTERAPIHTAAVILAIGKFHPRDRPGDRSPAAGLVEPAQPPSHRAPHQGAGRPAVAWPGAGPLQVPPLKLALGLGDAAKTLGEPAFAQRSVLQDGASLALAGGLWLRRARVMDRWRIEVVGAAAQREVFVNLGCFVEIIAYTPRVFVPVDKPAVLTAVLARWPAQSLLPAAA